jgi:ubiquinone/menaquinone biosynthesis C-methylase UbiE
MKSRIQNISGEIKEIADPWKGSRYYDDAEKWTFLFWDKSSLFRKAFDQLDLEYTIELACGHGRHAERVASRATHLVLMDVLQENIEFCRSRLAKFSNTEFFVNEGCTYHPVPDNTATAIFCYDAMVHFSPAIVESYLKDTKRVLAKGGRALYHHSNYPAPSDLHYGQNPHARNHMTQQLFKSMCDAAGLHILSSVPMRWGDIAELDCLTLVEHR